MCFQFSDYMSLSILHMVLGSNVLFVLSVLGEV